MLAVFGVMSIATYVFLPDMVQTSHDEHRGVFVDTSKGQQLKEEEEIDSHEEANEEAKDVDLAIDALSRDAEKAEERSNDRLPQLLSEKVLLRRSLL